MTPIYRVLHVEDSPDDAELVRFALSGAPFQCALTRVEAEPEFAAQLDAQAPDLVLCDYDLPHFSAARALQLLQERGLEVPFILVSHHIGENAAVVAMQQGASDYLPKGDLGRLPKAIEMALDRSRARREKARAEEALCTSEATQRGILNSLSSRIALLDGEGVIVAVNKAWVEFDATRATISMPKIEPGRNYLRILDRMASDLRGGFAEDLSAGIKAVIAGQSKAFSSEYELRVGSSNRWYVVRVVSLEGVGEGAVVSHSDETDRMISHVALQEANKRLEVLSKRTLAVQEDERRAISRELHDDVGQTASALKIGLHRLAQGVADPAGLTAECIGKADAVLEKLRQLSLDLRPPQLDQLGLEDALCWLAERQGVTTGLAIKCKFAGLENRRPPAALETACYRIAQEALNNATRHANAKNVLVSVESDGHLLKLGVHDDGVGFNEQAARQQVLNTGSMGLIGMEERAHLAGGRVKVRSVPGGGTTVSAIFPLERSAGQCEVAKAF